MKRSEAMMFKRKGSNNRKDLSDKESSSQRQMIVPKLIFQEEKCLPNLDTIHKPYTTTVAVSPKTRTKSLDSGKKTFRETSAKSDGGIMNRRKSDSIVRLSRRSNQSGDNLAPKSNETRNSLRLLDIRSHSGAESIISSRSGGSGGSRRSLSAAVNHRKKSESE